MAERQNRIRWPDGISLSAPIGPFGVGGTYYFDPGSPTAPRVTVTGGLGFGTSGSGLHAVFRRKGMTSEDALGYGVTGNVSSILPSVTVNGSIPDENYIPRPWKAKVSAIDAGIGLPGASAAVTYTATPQQIADFVSRHLTPPAIGPEDELSPFARTLRSGVGTVGVPNTPPIRYLSARYANPLGDGMGDWKSSVESYPQPPAQPATAPQEPGGLLGLIQDYMRNNPDTYR